MKTKFLKSIIIWQIAFFFTVWWIITVDFSSWNSNFSSLFIENASASGWWSWGSHSSWWESNYNHENNSNNSEKIEHSNTSSSDNSSNNSSNVQTSSNSNNESIFTKREPTSYRKPADKTAPKIEIIYPEIISNQYIVESQNWDFEFIWSITDNEDLNPEIKIQFNSTIYSSFQKMNALIWENELKITAKDKSWNLSEKIIKILRKKKKENISNQNLKINYQDTISTTQEVNSNNDLDSDWDWLTDKLELEIWTHPMLKDTDWDWINDWEEIINFQNPLSDKELFIDIQDKNLIKPIEFLIENWAIRTNTQSLFFPNKTINRAEAIKMLLNALNISIKSKTQINFQDVKDTDWYLPYLSTAIDKWIVDWKKINFEWYREINRVEALKIILNATWFPIPKVAPVEKPSYDTSNLEWYSPFISFAKKNNLIINWWQTIFRPAKWITRWEFAQILYKTIQLAKTWNYEIYEEMPEWEWLKALEEKNKQNIHQNIIAKKPNITTKNTTIIPKTISKKVIVKTPIQNNSQQDLIAKQKQDAIRQKQIQDAKIAQQRANDIKIAQQRALAIQQAQKIVEQKAAEQARIIAQSKAEAAKIAAQQAQQLAAQKAAAQSAASHTTTTTS